MNNTQKKYSYCTSNKFITDISELCTNCPLPAKIKQGIRDQVIFPAQEQKEILTEEQFKAYLDDAIKESMNGMQTALSVQNQNKNRKRDPYLKNRIEVYIWNKERIKVLNEFKMSISHRQQKKDTNYWIHDIEKEKTTESFKSCTSQIRMHGFYEVAETKVYTALLAHILTVKFEARTVPKNLTLLVNGLDYIPSYKEGYKEGIDYFKKHYSISPSILYSPQVKGYIDDLHQQYYHTRHYKLYEGWQFIKSTYSKTVNHEEIKQYGHYAGIVSEVDKLIKQYPTVFVDFHSCSEVEEGKEEIPQEKLTIKMIALKCFYQGIQITRKNSNSIVEQYGHKSGEKLFQQYTYYSSTANRTGKPHPFTKKKMRNKIVLFEKVLELLPPDKQERITDELNILKTHFDNEFG